MEETKKEELKRALRKLEEDEKEKEKEIWNVEIKKRTNWERRKNWNKKTKK